MKRWPTEAARDEKWVAMDAARRGRYTGEAVWRARHSDVDTEVKVKQLIVGVVVTWVMGWVAGWDFLGFWGLLGVVAFLLVCLASVRIEAWRRKRDKSWRDIALIFFPDTLYYRAKNGPKKKPPQQPPAPQQPTTTTAAASPFSPTEMSPTPSTRAKGLPPIPPTTGAASSPYNQAYSPWSGGSGGYSASIARGSYAMSPSFGGYSPQYSSLAPTPDVRRSLAYGSPYSRISGTPPCEFNSDRTNPDFQFRASPMPHDPMTPIAQLAETSFRNILKLTNKEGTSLSAEASTLQRDIANYLVILDKQISEVEKGIRDFKDSKEIKGTEKLEQFQAVNSLQEMFEGGEVPQAAAGFGGGFGGFGGLQRPAQPQVQKKKQEALQELVERLTTEVQMRGEMEVWGGHRPGKGDKLRLNQVLTGRLKLERVLCVERNYHHEESGTQGRYNRSQRQRFINRIRTMSADGCHDLRDEHDKVVLHCFASLLDTHYYGSRNTLAMDWSGPCPILRYTSNRCPGLLSLTIEATTYQGYNFYALRHTDTDLGISTTYYTDPAKSLYEAMLFFLIILDSKLNKQSAQPQSESPFSAIVRRVMFNKESY